MSIIFLLLLLISSCTSPVLCDKDDGSVLLKIKEQLGNPSRLESWVKGTNYCHYSGVQCISTGRVSYLAIAMNEFGTSFSAPFPKAICDLTGLMALQISNIQLYGPIPSCINKLSNLISIYITETTLSGPLPGFSYHQNLTAINIFKNRILSGSIPSSLSTLPNLLYLDLSSNYLTGTIPPGLVHNSSSMLFLSNNSLTGEIPEYYGWVDFNRFNVGHNRLSGDASFLFGKQKQAYSIFLNSNEFEFDLSYVQIPQNLGMLDLSHNKIWGTLPDSLASVDLLFSLNVSYNKLCGEIPQGGQMWQFKADSFVNNTCLCGKPLAPCFNRTPAPTPAPAPVFLSPSDSTP